MKETLGDRVEAVRVSGDRLVSSPCILVTSEWGWSANMQKIMRHQALRDDSMSSVMQGRKTMEINPDNSVIIALAERLDAEAEAVYVKDITTLLYETAMLQSGFDIEDVTNFCKRIHGMVRVGLGAEEETAGAATADMPKLEECDNNDDVDQVD